GGVRVVEVPAGTEAGPPVVYSINAILVALAASSTRRDHSPRGARSTFCQLAGARRIPRASRGPHRSNPFLRPSLAGPFPHADCNYFCHRHRLAIFTPRCLPRIRSPRSRSHRRRLHFHLAAYAFSLIIHRDVAASSA